MTTPQLYSKRDAAVRAAMAHFGRLAAEGSHFEIKRQQQPNGKYRHYYQPLEGKPGGADKPDRGRARRRQATRAAIGPSRDWA